MGAAHSRTPGSASAPALAERLKTLEIEDWERRQSVEKEYCFLADEKSEFDGEGDEVTASSIIVSILTGRASR